MSIKRTALLAFVATLLSLVMPVWNAVQIMMKIGSDHLAVKLSTIPATLLIILLSAIMPLFYFAVYRDPDPLRFSRRFRPWIFAAALLSAWITFVAFAQSVRGFGLGGASSLTGMRSAWNMGQIVGFIGPISDLSYLLLLVAFFQHANDEFTEVQSSSALLFVSTKVAVIVWSVIVVIAVIRVLLTPYTFSQLRDYAAQMGRSPRLWDLLQESIASLVSQGVLLVAPFIVYLAVLKRRVDAAAAALDGTTPAQ